MKKTLLALLTSSLFCSVSTQAANIEVGFENEQYNHKYDTSDVFMPYISTNFNPLNNSPLNISIKYMYQDQYGKKDEKTPKNKFKTKRDRLEMYAKGYKWSIGNYTFAPEFGFRYEQWAINWDENSKQDKRKLEIRIFPNMNYQMTDSTQLYFSGFVAPVFMETKQESRKDSSYVKGDLDTNKYYGDYYQELQLIGIKHSFANKDSIWTSLYNEYKYQEHGSKYTRWQFRLGYNWKVTTNLSINPFWRQDIYYKETNIETGSSNGLKRRKNESRVGAGWNYKLPEDFSLVGEIYYQTAKQQSYKEVYSDDKNRMFYKLAIKKSF